MRHVPVSTLEEVYLSFLPHVQVYILPFCVKNQHERLPIINYENGCD
jgi:hypothetical protein